MRGLLADHNADGHLKALLAALRGPEWGSLWAELALPAYGFADFALPVNTSDVDLWRFCQKNELVLVTGNRNDDGSTSLNRAIMNLGTTESLPVVTIADMGRVLGDAPYRRRAADRLMELLIDVHNVRGAGRVYIP